MKINVIKNIEITNGKFDLIISHEAPGAILPCISSKKEYKNAINSILEEIRAHSSFKLWCFGKYHMDKRIPPKYCALFEKLIKFSES